jgi:hypothetical protein
MSDTPWTPGPWEVYDTWNVRGGSESMVHICEANHRSVANARLIAAAPEMVEALHSWVMHHDHEDLINDDLLCEDTKDLLSRIRGKP